MKISRDFQESLITKIEVQFYDAMVADEPKFDGVVYVKNEMRDIISQLRFHILSFRFEDDLLLILLGMLEQTTNYLEKVESRHPSHSISA